MLPQMLEMEAMVCNPRVPQTDSLCCCTWLGRRVLGAVIGLCCWGWSGMSQMRHCRQNGTGMK